MAKEQDLSLNPQKISGLCGRLMCCLRYEYDAYKDFKSRAPKANATIQTPAGPAKVVELDVPREIVSLKVGDEKPVKVPLADFEPAEEGARPTTVGVAAWELATSEEARENRGDALTFLTSQFTGSDKLAEKGSVRRSGNAKRAGQTEASEPSASSKRSGQSSRKSRAAQPEPVVETRKPRRRRSTKIADGEVVEKTQAVETPAETPAERGEKKPSRRSRNRSQSAAGAQVSEGSKQSSTRESAGGEGKSSKEQGAKNPTRRSRNRGRGEKDAKGGVAVNEKVESVKTAPRPGQKSSGLRGAEGAPAPQKNGSEAASEEKTARRRPRRRTRSKANGAAETQGGSE